MTMKEIKRGPFLFPMPTVVVSAIVDGKPNFMTAAYVGMGNNDPPVVVCGLNPKHHTCSGIEQGRAFGINLPGLDQVQPVDYCGIYSGKKVDKSEVFKTFAGKETGAPLIEGCALVAECRLIESVKLAVDTLYIGEVLTVYGAESALTDDKPDWDKIEPLLYTAPDRNYRGLGQVVAAAWNAGRDYKP